MDLPKTKVMVEKFASNVDGSVFLLVYRGGSLLDGSSFKISFLACQLSKCKTNAFSIIVAR